MVDESERESDSTFRDQLALERTRLANERTLLAYARTAMMLAASGVTLIKIMIDSPGDRRFGMALIVAGIAIAAFGTYRFWSTKRLFN